MSVEDDIAKWRANITEAMCKTLNDNVIEDTRVEQLIKWIEPMSGLAKSLSRGNPQNLSTLRELRQRCKAILSTVEYGISIAEEK